MEQNAPIESGLGAFAKTFGDTIARGSENEQKQAFKSWLADKAAKNKKDLAEDPNKTAPARNPKTPAGKNDPQLVKARQALAAIQKLEDHLQKFGDTISNPMNVNNNPITVEHYKQYYKDALAQGKDAGSAMNIAKQKVFKDAYPDEATAIYNAHASGTIAHILQNYPQLANDFPTMALKYNIQPKPQPTPVSNPNPATTPVPQKTSMAPMMQPKPSVQPPTQVAQVPQLKSPMQPATQMAQIKMPPVGNVPVGPQSAPNTPIPGQGPASGQNEEELDNSPAIG